MTSETLRLLVLQVAAVAGIFGGFSARLMAGIRFVQTITQPDIWSQVWDIVYPDTPAGEQKITEAQRSLDSHPVKDDPFGFIDELASHSGKPSA